MSKKAPAPTATATATETTTEVKDETVQTEQSQATQQVTDQTQGSEKNVTEEEDATQLRAEAPANKQTLADQAMQTEKYDEKLGVCCWFIAHVVHEGVDIPVLAEDIAKAERLLKLRYPESPLGPVGVAKAKPQPGTLRILQRAPQVVTEEMRKRADPSDLAEIDRRGDLDYEIHH